MRYNLNCPGVKRLMKEAKELAQPTEEYYATPLEDNLFEWHFTVRGSPTTEFEGGFYHGRILLPTQYPMQPPNIILLTPNGRFEVNKKICLSISGYHPESWQPSWSIRTALLALIAFMPTPPAGTIGSLDYTAEERKALAKKSLGWECSTCGNISEKLLSAPPATSSITTEESTMIKQIALKAEEETTKKSPDVAFKVPRADAGNSDEAAPSHVAEESPSDCGVRQRAKPNASDVSVTPSATDTLLMASRESVNRDRFWSTVIWVLVSMITLLIIRRVFFV